MPWPQSRSRRDSSTMPATRNGTISHGVCLTAMASPIRTGPRQAARPAGPREPVPARGRADQQRHEQEVGNAADRVPGEHVEADHDGRERRQLPRQHRVEDHRAERPGRDVGPDRGPGRDARRQQRQVLLEGERRVGQLGDRLAVQQEGVAVRRDVEKREGRGHGVQVRVDPVQCQLGRVLVEGDLVGAVVGGDVELETTPHGQGGDDRGQDGQVDLALAAAGQRARGQPGRDDGQQPGQAHQHDRDGQPCRECQVAGQTEGPGDEEDRCQRPQRPLGPGRGFGVSLAAARPAGGGRCGDVSPQAARVCRAVPAAGRAGPSAAH